MGRHAADASWRTWKPHTRRSDAPPPAGTVRLCVADVMPGSLSMLEHTCTGPSHRTPEILHDPCAAAPCNWFIFFLELLRTNIQYETRVCTRLRLGYCGSLRSASKLKRQPFLFPETAAILQQHPVGILFIN